jgi:hypothetical protein
MAGAIFMLIFIETTKEFRESFLPCKAGWRPPEMTTKQDRK